MQNWHYYLVFRLRVCSCSPHTGLSQKKHEKSTPLIKKAHFETCLDIKNMNTHLKYYYYCILFIFLLFNFSIFFIWPPLAGGYLHHNILTYINNILTTETAGPNNKSSPYSHPLTLYYSLILWSNFLTIF